MAFARLREDIATILEKDPAARSRAEVLFCYPGLHAVMMHRLSAPLWRRGWRFLPRLLSHIAKVLTGVEIHPGATLGRRLFIDHATGVVIGETAEVGDDVTLYHGVTLGGTSLHNGKRHPTLKDGVIVGSGGQVLGPITIGAEARVGANAVVLSDVPSGATVVGIPARVVRRDRVDAAHHCEFQAYGTPTDGITDPVARTITGLTDHVGRLAARVEELERRLAAGLPGTAADGAIETAPGGHGSAGDDTGEADAVTTLPVAALHGTQAQPIPLRATAGGGEGPGSGPGGAAPGNGDRMAPEAAALPTPPDPAVERRLAGR